jgi:hypothetical protein
MFYVWAVIVPAERGVYQARKIVRKLLGRRVMYCSETEDGLMFRNIPKTEFDTSTFMKTTVDGITLIVGKLKEEGVKNE